MLLSIFRWIIGIIFSFFAGSAAIISSILTGSGDIVHFITRVWGMGMCRLTGVRVEVIGAENILRDRAQIFTSNHQGMYDIFALQGYLPIRFLWIAKESLFKIPVIGRTMRKAGYIGINRSSPKKFLKSLQRAVEEIKEGRSIVVFPEGTRTKDGAVGTFKRGSLYLIFKTGAPVVPITISGSFDVMKKGEFLIRPGIIRIFIDKPIDVSRFSENDEDTLLNMLRGVTVKNLQEMERAKRKD
jgi:1-acyl-sn-glycerol-3-phosphate acyltransferase